MGTTETRNRPSSRWAAFGTLGPVLALVAVDVVVVVASILTAMVVRREVLPVLNITDAFLPVRNYVSLWPALVLLLLGRAGVGLYPGYGLHPAEDLKRQTLVALGLVSIVFAGGTLFKFADDYSRVVMVISAAFFMLALPIVRSGAKALMARTGFYGAPIWIVGDSGKARNLADLLKRNPEMGLRPCGSGLNALDAPPEVRSCLVVPDGLAHTSLASLLDDLNDRFERVWLVPNLLDVASVWVAPRDLQGHLTLELRNNLLEARNQVLKRLLDLGIALVALPFGLVASFVLVPVIALDSRGAVIIKQTRIGKGGQPFTVLKFRSMHANAEALLDSYLADNAAAKEEWGRTRKLVSDPRITRAGKWLRRSSLDELPQIVNVLLGQMSFVGPRPTMPDEVSRYGNHTRFLLKVKPGVTGLAQVSGRSNLNYDDRVRMDTYYVRNWSVWLDLVILARTVGAVLKGSGAF